MQNEVKNQVKAKHGHGPGVVAARSPAGVTGRHASRESARHAAGEPDAPVVAKGQITGVGGGASLVYSNGNTGALALPVQAQLPPGQKKT